MARPKKNTTLPIKEIDLSEARRLLSRKRSRASKFDAVLDATDKLGTGKALQVEGLSYSNVLALRKKLKEQIGENVKAESARVGDLYDVIIYKEA